MQFPIIAIWLMYLARGKIIFKKTSLRFYNLLNMIIQNIGIKNVKNKAIYGLRLLNCFYFFVCIFIDMKTDKGFTSLVFPFS